MAVVIAALLPVFLLIVLGFVLKRTLMRLETQWHGLERLTYYVLFPMLLIQTLVKADLTKVPVAGVGGALFLSALRCRCCASRCGPRLRGSTSTAPPSPRSSRARPAGRPMWRCPSPANLFGDVGLALASVAMVAIIPLVNVLSVARARPLRFAGKAVGARRSS